MNTEKPSPDLRIFYFFRLDWGGFSYWSVAAENGATAGKFELAKKAKQLNLDAIHDTVHEMARDEARHGKAFKGLLDRYFGK